MLHIINVVSATSTKSSRTTHSRRRRTRNFNSFGWQRTIWRPRTSKADHWALWESTECDESSHCRARFGTARRRATASRRSLALFSATGTYTVRIRRLVRSESSLKPLVWPLHKWAIGSRIGDNAIELPRPKRGTYITKKNTTKHTNKKGEKHLTFNRIQLILII